MYSLNQNVKGIKKNLILFQNNKTHRIATNLTIAIMRPQILNSGLKNTKIRNLLKAR